MTKPNAIDATATSSTPAPAAKSVGEVKACYDRTAAARAAITDATKRALTFNLVDGTVLVRRSLPAVLPYRDVIIGLGKITAEEFDSIDDCAVAAWYAHTVWVAAARPAAPLAELLARAMKTRDDLMDSARAAARRGHIVGSRLGELDAGRSASEVAQNLNALCVTLRDGWEKMVGQTALTLGELEQAEQLAADLFEALQLRDGTSTALARAADERTRAGSVLVNRWDEVRRGLTFDRWHHGDADVIAPSLYQRASSKRDDEEGAGEEGARGEPDEAGKREEVGGAPRGNGGGASGGGGGAGGNGGSAKGGSGNGGGGKDGDPSTREGMPNSNPLGGGEDDDE